jgi:hypothetical protein
MSEPTLPDDDSSADEEPDQAGMANRRWRTTKAWSDLSPGQKRAVVVAGLAQTALLTAAQVDLVRRPADQVRGPKPAWFLANFVNVVGPVSYFAVGRTRSSH